MYQSRVSDRTISKLIPEVADTILKVLKDDYFKFSEYTEEWLEISRGIMRNGSFQIVLGVMDGKHTSIKLPKRRWINVLQLKRIS